MKPPRIDLPLGLRSGVSKPFAGPTTAHLKHVLQAVEALRPAGRLGVRAKPSQPAEPKTTPKE
jgi:hypothetical protein